VLKRSVLFFIRGKLNLLYVVKDIVVELEDSKIVVSVIFIGLDAETILSLSGPYKLPKVFKANRTPLIVRLNTRKQLT
jgi:hypothetical protein